MKSEVLSLKSEVVLILDSRLKTQDSRLGEKNVSIATR